MKNPFIVGNWVRGDHFFGRKKILAEILEGSHNAIWVAGTRRSGKTSLLKQLEYLTSTEQYSCQYLSLFWDLEGSNDLPGLNDSIMESIEDAEERFSAIGITCDELAGLSAFEVLRAIKRKAKQYNLKLLILCDECEELITIGKNNPEVLPKLRRIFQQGENIVTVITATKRLGKLEEKLVPDTSPFLHGFIPPRYLTQFDDDEAEQLIGQGNFDRYIVKDIKEKTNNHPYLIQLICKRLFDNANYDQVLQEVSTDEMVSHFFEVDFNYLVKTEKEVLWHLLQQENKSLQELENNIEQTSEKLVNSLYSLLQLGYIKQRNNHFSISNYFFEKWLVREQDRLFADLPAPAAKEPSTGAKEIPDSTRQLTIGTTLSHYLILEEIGAGGMSLVYKAKDLKLERTVALKILHPQIVTEEQALQRFILEAKAASSLNHPNITTIYEFDQVEGIYFIAMEYVSGVTLSQLLKKGALSVTKVLDLARQIAAGLAFAHRQKVVHRDMKSTNIKVTDDGLVKILDFGIAKFLDRDRITQTGCSPGTLAYMSPEQASQAEVDHRSDIFSYGIVLYELLTGQLPFTGDYELAIAYSIMNETPAPITQINPDVPEALEKIVFKALEKYQENRYQNVEQLLTDLKQVQDSQ